MPSSGSTATSTSGGLPFPTSSPLKSIGASSFSPSPMTTTPFMATVSSIARMASTAAWSAASLSPRPTQRAQLSAADSVTRTSSSARFRSGATPFPPAMAGNLHPLGCFDPHEVERASDHGRGCLAEREAERLLLALEHAVVVVEAVEVVGDADGVRREGMRAATLGRLGDDRGELGEPLDELALCRRQTGRRAPATKACPRRFAGCPRSGRARTGRSRPGSSRCARARGRRRCRSPARGSAKAGASEPRRRRSRREARRGRRRPPVASIPCAPARPRSAWTSW